jgi:hypothetical protein
LRFPVINHWMQTGRPEASLGRSSPAPAIMLLAILG